METTVRPQEQEKPADIRLMKKKNTSGDRMIFLLVCMIFLSPTLWICPLSCLYYPHRCNHSLDTTFNSEDLYLWDCILVISYIPAFETLSVHGCVEILFCLLWMFPWDIKCRWQSDILLARHLSLCRWKSVCRRDDVEAIVTIWTFLRLHSKAVPSEL